MKNKYILILVLVLALLIIGAGVFYYLLKKKIITPSAQTTPASLYLDPASGAYAIGSFVDTKIMLDTAGRTVDGVDIYYLHYNATMLEVQDADANTAGIQIKPGTIFSLYVGNSVDTSNPSDSKIRISGIVNPGSPGYTGSGVFATVNFKVLAAGDANLGFDFTPGSTSDTNVTEHGTSVDILGDARGATYTLQGATPAPTVDLKADGSDGPITKNAGEQATLSWTSTDASSCSAGGGWSGTQSTSGSQPLSGLVSSTAYTLTCTGAGGSAQDSVTINVTQPGKNPPTVDIKANGQNGPITITTGTSAILSWTSTRANSCSATGAWSGGKATSGSESTGALSSSKTYSLTCQNGDGTTIDSVTINVSSTGQTSTGSTGTTSTPKQATKLPSNIQTPTKPTQTALTLTKNEAMKPWALWFLYAIIPAFLAGGAIYLYLRRRKVNRRDQSI